MNFSTGTDFTSCWNGVKLQTSVWNSILIGLAATNTNNNVVLDGGYSQYNGNGATARLYLTTPVSSGGRGWTISDGGAAP